MIRPARLQDAAAIADLATQLGYPTDAATMAARLEDIAGAVLVHEEAGQVIAWLHIAAWPSLTADRTGRILAFVVDQDHRGRGIGAALLEAAESWARERAFLEVTVSSRMHRERTHAFYERAGYQVVKTQKTFRKTLS